MMQPRNLTNIRFVVEATCQCHPGLVGRGDTTRQALEDLEANIDLWHRQRAQGVLTTMSEPALERVLPRSTER
jgi:hypothetical protein